MFGQKDKVALFVDGSNFFESVKETRLRIDYSRIREYFARRETVLRAFYFTAVLPDSPEKNDPIRPLLDWLSFHEWSVITKPVKILVDPVTNVQTIKGNMDNEITTEMLSMAEHVQHLVLFSGDEDFTYSLKWLKAKGKRITVVSSSRLAAHNLRKEADVYLDLSSMKEFFERDGRVRAG